MYKLLDTCCKVHLISSCCTNKVFQFKIWKRWKEDCLLEFGLQAHHADHLYSNIVYRWKVLFWNIEWLTYIFSWSSLSSKLDLSLTFFFLEKLWKSYSTSFIFRIIKLSDHHHLFQVESFCYNFFLFTLCARAKLIIIQHFYKLLNELWLTGLTELTVIKYNFIARQKLAMVKKVTLYERVIHKNYK